MYLTRCLNLQCHVTRKYQNGGVVTAAEGYSIVKYRDNGEG